MEKFVVMYKNKCFFLENATIFKVKKTYVKIAQMNLV